MRVGRSSWQQIGPSAGRPAGLQRVNWPASSTSSPSLGFRRPAQNVWARCLALIFASFSTKKLSPILCKKLPEPGARRNSFSRKFHSTSIRCLLLLLRLSGRFKGARYPPAPVQVDCGAAAVAPSLLKLPLRFLAASSRWCGQNCSALRGGANTCAGFCWGQNY